jgi:hypothetical protein
MRYSYRGRSSLAESTALCLIVPANGIGGGGSWLPLIVMVASGEPFYFVRYAMRVLRAGPMIAHDGPISVARAFTAVDWQSLIAEAGIPLERVRISWVFPFRYCVAGRMA